MKEQKKRIILCAFFVVPPLLAIGGLDAEMCNAYAIKYDNQCQPVSILAIEKTPNPGCVTSTEPIAFDQTVTSSLRVWSTPFKPEESQFKILVHRFIDFLMQKELLFLLFVLFMIGWPLFLLKGRGNDDY